MPHLTQQPGDTVHSHGWWWRDEDDLMDALIEYAKPEYRDDDREDDE